MRKLEFFAKNLKFKGEFFWNLERKLDFFCRNLNFCDAFWYLFDVLQIVLRDFLNFWRWFFLVPGAKVGILGVDLKFKGEFFGNLNRKLNFFAGIWTLGAGVLFFWGLLIFFLIDVAFNKEHIFLGKILAWFWGYLPRELIDFYWNLVRKLKFWA